MKKKAKPSDDSIYRSSHREEPAMSSSESEPVIEPSEDPTYARVQMNGFPHDEEELQQPHNFLHHLPNVQRIQANPDPNLERRVDGRMGKQRRTVLDPDKKRPLWSRRGFRYGVIFGGLLLVAGLIVFISLILPKIQEDSLRPTPENSPIHYADLIAFYSEANELDPFLVAAVMRTESDYRPEIVSSAGAIGLMQILPDTGVWLGERIGVQVAPEDLTQPVLNIRLGTSFLRYLIHLFDGEIPTAVAAYNAGQGNVGKWLEDEEYSDDGRTLKAIPFAETRNYVERVQVRTERYHEAYDSVFPGNADEAFESKEEAEANINQ